MTPSVLIIDDEANILTSLSRALQLEGMRASVAGSASIASEKLGTESFDLLLLDVHMPELDGLEFLRNLRKKGDETPVIVMSGQASIKTAVEATQLGAFDFVEKPIQTDRLFVAIRNALEFQTIRNERNALATRAAISDRLLGESDAIKNLKQTISMAARSKASVLIMGERGTGKELVARALHAESDRHRAPLELLNCAAVPENLVESEMFGHEAGAFTGATKMRRGKFERADKGTLFLDEIGDMPSSMQAKLLRVLQEGEIERVGGSASIAVDVRVIAATNRALTDMVDDGDFRADLFDRLNVIPIRVPSLRERPDDIPLLIRHFLELAAARHAVSEKQLTEAAERALSAREYPGNVRELQNLVERIAILSPSNEIDESALGRLLQADGPREKSDYFDADRPLKDMLADAERDLIERALHYYQGHVTRTAEALGLERSHLYKKMKALGLR
ncbi:MAG: sigma-54 dependent transcriptional regulator [Polyangiales bacterium]